MSAVNPASFAAGGAPTLQHQQQHQQQHQHQHQQQSKAFTNARGPPIQPLGLSQPPSSAPIGSDVMGFPQPSFARTSNTNGNGSNSRDMMMLPPGLAIPPSLSNPLMYSGPPNHLPNNPTSSPCLSNHGYPHLYQNGGPLPPDMSGNGGGLGPRYNGGSFGSLKNGRPPVMMMDDPSQQQPNHQYRSAHQNMALQHPSQHMHRGMMYRNGNGGQWDHRPAGMGVGVGVNGELARGMSNLGLA